MADVLDGLIERFLLSSGEFERRLRAVRTSGRRAGYGSMEEPPDASLVSWIDEHLDEIYAGLAETPHG